MRDLARWFMLPAFIALTLYSVESSAYETSGRVTIRGEQGMLDLSFSDLDRKLIQEHYHYRSRYRQYPPGLAKKGIPRGHQKKYKRHDHLPPHFMYQRSAYNRLPRELERRLSRLPNGCFRVVIGGSVILFDDNTKLILDVIHGLD